MGGPPSTPIPFVLPFSASSRALPSSLARPLSCQLRSIYMPIHAVQRRVHQQSGVPLYCRVSNSTIAISVRSLTPVRNESLQCRSWNMSGCPPTNSMPHGSFVSHPCRLPPSLTCATPSGLMKNHRGPFGRILPSRVVMLPSRHLVVAKCHTCGAPRRWITSSACSACCIGCRRTLTIPQ